MTKFPRQKWLMLLVVILLLTNIITLAFFWSMRPQHHDAPFQNQKPGERERRMGLFMVNEMKFDKQQEDTYWKLRDSMVNQQRPLMDSIRDAKKQFFDLLKQPAPADSVVRAANNNVARLQQKLDMLTFTHFQQVRTLCKPEQVAKFDTVIKEIVYRMTTFRRPGPGGPGGKPGDKDSLKNN
ncbi:MAG: hypothetical protein QM731_13400 [Chitinophagaceae bacterium]